MKTSAALFFTRSALFFIVLPALAGPWPAWRGPDGTGVTSEKGLPLQWTSSENVVWRADLPERGNSSPIVWGDKVFVTQAVSSSQQRTVMCFDRATGKVLWQSGPTYTGRESTQRDNPYCSATPATDGERVVASFGSAGLYCYDFAGKELWHRDLGPMNHMFGNAASPVIVGDLCILNFGPDEKARLIAVNKNTGETAWEAQAPKVAGGEQPPGDGSGGRGGARGGGDRAATDRPATDRPATDRPTEQPAPTDERPRGEQRPGGERPGVVPRGDRGIRGGFGPGQMIAPLMLSQADKDGDHKISAEEFSALAADWFAKLDKEQAGKIDQETFTSRIGDLLAPSAAPAPEAAGGPRPEGARRGGFGGGRFLGAGLFAAADTNKDGSLTREEWLAAFSKWFADWDTDKTASLDETKLIAGLNAALPRPQFGGRGGSDGAPGGGGFGRGGFGPGGGGRGGGASWSTPVLVTADGRQELVISLPGSLAAYDPKTGEQLWFSTGLGNTIYTSPVAGDGEIVAMTSGPGGGNAMAVRPGGSGDVTDSQRVWRQERFKSGIGSGVIHEGYLYTISQEGVASCSDLKTGNTVWEERLRGSGSRGSSWSSILLADGKLYVPNQSGDVFVLQAGPKFQLLATNSVNESTSASLAASDGELFLRTDKALWCFANSKK